MRHAQMCAPHDIFVVKDEERGKLLFHTSLDHLLNDERGNIVGIGVHAEAGIEAQLLGQFVGDARAAAAANHLVAQALGLHQLDEVGQVLDVHVFLCHRL